MAEPEKPVYPVYSQKDKRWSNLLIGETNLTVGKDGCLIVSLAMLFNQTPDVILSILNKNNCFNPEGYLMNLSAAKVFNKTYEYTTINPDRVCICETDHFKAEKYPQHFFLNLNNGMINDPLDGKQKVNPYQAVSWRCFDVASPGTSNNRASA